jgi:putative ABC transport system permease protein
MSNSDAVPGDQENDGSYKLSGSSATQFVNMSIMRCDVDFQKTYQMSLAEGRFFSYEHPSDTMAVIINQAAARVLGSNNLIGKYLNAATRKLNYQIIGIVKDFNFKSLHEAVSPLIIRPAVSKNFVGRFLSIRINPADYAGTKSFLESTWKKYAGDVAIDYAFLDQDLQKLYMSDERTSKIASIFSILAIFIACLGLLGLATFITEQRTKEIGIRKVLGASVPEIMVLLSKEFAKWVLIANLIAWPVAYYLMNKWLQDFAYKTEISIWVFLTAGILALIIALLTVSANAIKAATANPVKSLKYE